MSDPTSSSVSFPIHDPNDKRPLPEIIAEHYGFPLALVDVEDGTRYYAVQDWIRGVAQTSDPTKFWNAMKRRLKTAKIDLSIGCRLIPYRLPDGRTYQMDYATATGLYQITQRMVANSGLRNQILQFLSKAGVLVDDMR